MAKERGGNEQLNNFLPLDVLKSYKCGSGPESKRFFVFTNAWADLFIIIAVRRNLRPARVGDSAELSAVC